MDDPKVNNLCSHEWKMIDLKNGIYTCRSCNQKVKPIWMPVDCEYSLLDYLMDQNKKLLYEVEGLRAQIAQK